MWSQTTKVLSPYTRGQRDTVLIESLFTFFVANTYIHLIRVTFSRHVFSLVIQSYRLLISTARLLKNCLWKICCILQTFNLLPVLQWSSTLRFTSVNVNHCTRYESTLTTPTDKRLVTYWFISLWCWPPEELLADSRLGMSAGNKKQTTSFIIRKVFNLTSDDSGHFW